MIPITAAIVAAVLLLASAWACWVMLRKKPKSVSEAIDHANTVYARVLTPFVELRNTAGVDDEKMWNAIDRYRGLWAIYREAGIFVNAGISIGLNLPEERQDFATPIVVDALYLRGQLFLCLIEALVKSALPCLPRVQLRGMARLYCEIAVSLDVARSIC